MMTLRLLCLIGLVAGIHCGMARRDLGAKSGGGGYGAPAPIGYGAVPPAPTYGAPPAPSYGAGPVSSYAAYGHAPVHYEHHKEKPDLKAKFEEFKSKLIGNLGYFKGSLLAAKGKMMLKKAHEYQEKGEKLLGIGESLKALKQEKYHEPQYVPPPPAPAYPAASGYSG